MPPALLEKLKRAHLCNGHQNFTVTANDGFKFRKRLLIPRRAYRNIKLEEIKGYTVTKPNKSLYTERVEKFKDNYENGISKATATFASTYTINESGYTGTIPTKIDWSVNLYYPTQRQQ